MSALLLVGLIGGCGPGTPPLEENLERADALITDGRHAGAIEILEELNTHYTGNPQVLEGLAFAYSGAGQHKQAAFYFAQLAESDSRYLHYQLYAARALRDAGDLSGAADEYAFYLELRPEDAGVWASLGSILRERGRPREAVEAYLRSHRIEADGAVALQLGRLFLDLGNTAQAETWFRTAMQTGLESVEPEALLGLFGLAMQQRNYARAEEILARLDQGYPGYFDRSPLAGNREELQTWRERQNELARRLAEQQRMTRQTRELARTLREPPATDEGGVDEVSPQVEGTTPPGAAAGSASPEEATRPERGSNQPGILTEQEAPRQVGPVPPVPLFDGSLAGQAAAGPGDRPEPETARARQSAGDTTALNATLPPLERGPLPNSGSEAGRLLAQARASKAAGNVRDAIQAYWASIKADDTPAVAWYGLSEAYLRNGNAAFAEATALEARRRASSDPAYTLHYLEVVRESQSPAIFFRELVRAYERFPENAEITLRLARAYREIQNNPARARLLYEEFLRLVDPSDPRRSSIQGEMGAL